MGSIGVYSRVSGTIAGPSYLSERLLRKSGFRVPLSMQVDSKHDVDFLKKYLSFKLDTDNYTLRALSEEQYQTAVQSGLAMTKAVDKEKILQPEVKTEVKSEK